MPPTLVRVRGFSLAWLCLLNIVSTYKSLECTVCANIKEGANGREDSVLNFKHMVIYSSNTVCVDLCAGS